MFPIDQPSETLLSTAFFLEKSAELGSYRGQIEDRLEAAAISQGILEPYLDMRNQYHDAQLYKEAAEQETFALDTLVGDTVLKRFPLNSPEDIVKSAEALEAQIDKLSPGIAKEASRRLMKQADYYRVPVDQEKINAYCGQRGVDLQKLAEHMIFRSKRATNEIHRKSMLKAAQAVVSLPEWEIEFEKIAEFIDTYDQAVGTYHLVRKGTIPDGYNTVFNSPLFEKVAGVKLAGKDYSEEDFASLPVEKWSEALGEDFVEAATEGGVFKVAQAIEMASTLPLPDARILREYLEGNIEKKAFIGAAGMAAASSGGRPSKVPIQKQKTSMNPFSGNFRGLMGGSWAPSMRDVGMHSPSVAGKLTNAG
jgi:hypothetical protein